MSSLSEITKRIEEINKLSKQLNNERAVNIGKRETLEKQLNDAVHTYNEAYGSSLDISKLDEEIERVVSEKEKEVSRVESMLSLIREGRYTEAQALAGDGQVSTSAEVDGTQPSGVVHDITPPVSEPVGVVPNTAPPISEPAGVPVTPSPVSTPSSEMPAIPARVPITPPSGVVPNTAPPVSEPAGVPVTPPSGVVPNTAPPVSEPAGVVDTPVAPPPMSFNAILGGSMFKPQ